MTRPWRTQLAQSRAKNLRRKLTISEARVWGAIKAGKLGARFRRQAPIGIWIVDFVCLELMIVIEIDDPSHDEKDESDRNTYLQSQGFAILRFTNEEVATHFPEVVNTIENWIREHKR